MQIILKIQILLNLIFNILKFKIVILYNVNNLKNIKNLNITNLIL